MTQLIWILIALQAADVATTVLALRAGAVEANPVMRALQMRLGTLTGTLAMKALFIAVTLGAHFTVGVHLWALACLIALYVYVVVNNLVVIRRAH
jgi:hypothetical protein